MEAIKADICVYQINSVTVRCHTEEFGYDCLNVTGNQVCFTSRIYSDGKKSGPWSDERSNPLGFRVREHMPVCLFYGKKEGDEVELKFKDKHGQVRNVTVKLNQNRFSKKTFEEALYERTPNFGGICSPCRDNNLSRLKQCCFVIAAHEQYAESIGKPTIEPHEFRNSIDWITYCKEESEKQPRLSALDKVLSALNDVTVDDPAKKLGQALGKVLSASNDDQEKTLGEALTKANKS